MSDCANGGRNVYQRPHETLRMRMEFVGENQPWMYALALNGREVDALYLDEVRYVPESASESRWHELFGTPERAARTLAGIACDDGGCEGCPLYDANCSYDSDTMLKWLRGDA